MKKEKIIAKATGAELDIGIGFKPDRVRILNVTDRTELIWDGAYLTGQLYGMTVAVEGDKAAAAATYGVTLYDGVGVLGEADATIATILVAKDDDLKDTITKFTMDTVANKTGHFDASIDTDTVGVGSRIVIEGKVYIITALTNDGDASDEVTLDAAPVLTISSVDSVFSKYTHRGAIATDAVPQGIKIGANAVVNDTDGDLLVIEAELF